MIGSREGRGDESKRPSCCISHEFVASASRNPNKIAVVRAAGGLRLFGDSGLRSGDESLDLDAALVSSSPPIYEGDECFSCADLLSAVDSLSRRIRWVLDGGQDPDLVRPKADLHGRWSVAISGDVESSLTSTNGVSSFDRTPKIVGIHIGPSMEYIVAVLSILRCGEAFLPLDPSWPEERILSVVSSSRTSLIIKCPHIYCMDKSWQSDAVDWIIDSCGCSVLYVSMKAGLKENYATDLVWPCESKRPRKFCYLMYTSGSSGKPKGVCGTEIGLLNRFGWMQDQFPLCGEDILLFKTSISFVDHLQEFLGAILSSTTLVIPPFDEFKSNPLCLVNFIEAYNISRLTSVPSLMRAILPSLDISQWMPICKSLKVLVLSGETLSISLWKLLRELLPETTILNLYGSTEVSGDCAYFDCKSLPQILDIEPLSSVPIGVPISNCELDLICETDTRDEGEIYVGGACLFTGYFGEPLCGLSLRDDGTPLHFRTGDYAKRLQSGDLVFLCRKDRTIKVHGQRVALEEIENAIREHPDVSDAAVTFQKADGDLSHLEAFFVMTEKFQRGSAFNAGKVVEELIASVRSWLVWKLPPAMIPSHYYCIDQLPVSASGKIDYAMLKSSTCRPKRLRDESRDIHFHKGNMQIIKEAFRDVLLVEEVSDHDDFFMMGGNSISAAHVAHKLRIDMRLLYVFPTPVLLLNALVDQTNSNAPFLSPNHVSGKRAKVLNDMLSSSDSAIIYSQNNRFLGGQSQENGGEGVHDHFVQLNADQSINKNGDSPSIVVSLGVSSLPPTSNALVSVYGDGDLWLSNSGLPIVCAFSRGNQFMIEGKVESTNVHQSFFQTKIPRYKKGCLQELWKVFLRSCVDASPLVVCKDGNINLFIGSHSHIFQCIDAFSGILQWEVILEGRIECSAAITGDFTQVIVGCYKGRIYFLDYMTGNISWVFHTDGEVKMQPVVDNHRSLIWCGSHDHCLYALDYKKRCCVYKISCGGSIYGSPAMDMVHNMIYVASTSGRVCGISTKVLPFSMVWLYESGSPIFGSLSVDSFSGNVICCLVDGCVLALNSKGVVVWKATIGGPIFAGACISSALPSQVLICSRNGSLYSFDAEGGDILWEYQVGDPITASAYVDEQSQLVPQPSNQCDRLVCVCSCSGRINVLRVNSNAKKERLQGVQESPMVQEFAATVLPGDIFSSPVMIGGRIFVGCRDDYVHCINVLT